jgi:hypothetical protein
MRSITGTTSSWVQPPRRPWLKRAATGPSRVELRDLGPLSPSMRTTGDGVVQVRLCVSDVRIGLDKHGHRRHGCCTLVLHSRALTLSVKPAHPWIVPCFDAAGPASVPE